MRAVLALWVLTGAPPAFAGDVRPATGSSPGFARETPAKERYERYCALCHGSDRGGYANDDAPSLRSKELLASGQEGYLFSVIADGLADTPMAAFSSARGGPLSVREIDDLVRWLAQGTAPVALDRAPLTADPARGRLTYDGLCASCHGPPGQSGSAPNLFHGERLRAASDGFLRYAIRYGRTGTAMRGYPELPPDAIDEVIAYLRAGRTGSPQPANPTPPPERRSVVINPGAKAATFEVRDGMFVPARQVAQALKEGRRLVLLDARPHSDWLRGHLPGAVSVPFYDSVDALARILPSDDTYLVAYCACPHAASGKVARELRARGFQRAVVLDEGSLFWARQGYPMTKP